MAMHLILILFLLPLSVPSAADDIKDAASALRRGIATRDQDAIRSAIDTLVKAGGADAVKPILPLAKAVASGEASIYWLLVYGICSFQDKDALAEIGSFITRNRGQGTARDVLFALQRNSSVHVLAPMKEILTEAPTDMRLMALDVVAGVDAPETVDLLLEIYRKEEGRGSELKKRVIAALRGLTGESLGDSLVNWEGWWKKNRTKDLSSLRRRVSRSATMTVIDDLDPIRRGEFFGVEKLDPIRVVVIKDKRDQNNFDHIENILEEMEVPRTVVNKEEFEDKKFTLNGVMALFINCTRINEYCICPDCKPGGGPSMRLYRCTGCNKHIIVRFRLGKKGLQKIREFVLRGGYLFTEDWVLEEVIEKAFPKFIKRGIYLEGGTVKVVPTPGQTSHPYLRMVFGSAEEDVDLGLGIPKGLKEVACQWKVDLDSPSIHVLNPNRVTVLLKGETSELVKEEDEKKGREPGDAVAVTFRPGRAESGAVLHILSHFGKQESQLDEYTLQNLLVNFLIEARSRTRVLTKGERRDGASEGGE